MVADFLDRVIFNLYPNAKGFCATSSAIATLWLDWRTRHAVCYAEHLK